MIMTKTIDLTRKIKYQKELDDTVQYLNEVMEHIKSGFKVSSLFKGLIVLNKKHDNHSNSESKDKTLD